MPRTEVKTYDSSAPLLKRAAMLAVPFSAILVAVWICVWVSLIRDHAVVAENSAASVSTLAGGLRQQTLRTIQQMDLLARLIKQQYEKAPESFDLKRDLPANLFSTDATIQATIVGERGEILQSTISMARGVNLSDREHFRALREDPGLGLFMGRPVVGRVSHQNSVQMARRIEHRDGSFAGVVVVSVNPDFLTDSFYNTVELGTRGVVAVVSNTGFLFAARSSRGPIGFPGQQLTKVGVDPQSVSVIDDVERVSASAPVDGYPITVIVGVAKSDVFARFNRERLIYIAIAVGVSLLIAAFFATVLAMLQRQVALAETDPLTRLPNRRKAVDLVNALVQGGAALGRVAVLYIDLDNFGRVNDRFGHDAGDDGIKLLARRLQRSVGSVGRVARMGGDEFLVIIRSDGVTRAAEDIARLVVAAIGKPLGLRGESYFLRASIGVAICNDAADSGVDLIVKADQAMYAAKALAKAGTPVRYETYTQQIAENHLRLLNLDQEILRALEEREFFVMFQPISDLASGRLVSCAAVLKWRHPERGIVGADEFMARSEATRAIIPISDFMIESVCEQIALGMLKSTAVPVLVKLSAVYLETGYVVDGIQHFLNDYGVDPGLLHLELSESSVIEDAEQNRQIDRLRRAGVKIFVSDVRASYTSLVGLWKVPVDGVKFDSSFFAALPQEPQATTIVTAVARAADALGHVVVIEGVRTEEHMDRLRQLPGIVYVQGTVHVASLPDVEAASHEERR